MYGMVVGRIGNERKERKDRREGSMHVWMSAYMSAWMDVMYVKYVVTIAVSVRG